MKAHLTAEGDSFRLQWQDAGIGAVVDRLRENSHGEIHAEVRWHGLHTVQGQLTENGHIHGPTRVNLTGTQTQKTLATFLAARKNDVPWAEVIEQAFALSVREYRRGVPPVDLADVAYTQDRPYLLYPLLPEGENSMLYADGGSGKSLTALAIARAIRLGLRLPGCQAATRRVEVAYFDWETNSSTHRRRLGALSGWGAVPRGIHYFFMPKPIGGEAERMRAECARLGVGLAIIDSAGYAIGGDMKEGSPVTDLFAALRSLKITVLILHHMSKAAAGQESGAATAYGSAYFRNSARNAWELRSIEGEDDELKVGLIHRKDNDGSLVKKPLGWLYRWDAERRCAIDGFDVGEEAELAAHQGAAFALYGLLKHEQLTVSDLVERTGLARDTVKKALTRSPKFRQVEYSGPGRGHEARWGLAHRIEPDPEEDGEVPF